MKKLLQSIFLLVILIYYPTFASDRAEISFSSTPTLDDDLNLNVEIYVNSRSQYPIQDVRIFYRELSENTFHSQFLKSQGFRYLASVNMSKFKGSVVEYYFGVEYIDGSEQSHPSEAPEHNLYKIAIQDEEEETDGAIEVISPEPDETVYTDEFILTVSFYQYSSMIDKERTKLYLDTWDVSQYLNVFDEFLTFAPNKVPPGQHKLRLELYDKSGNLLATKTISFTALARRGPSLESRALNVSGNAFAESRYEDLADGNRIKHYATGGVRLSVSGTSYSFGARLYLSNQDKSNTQYIDRYTSWFQYDFWNNRYFRITGGDAYPQLNPYLLQNIFVRGFHSQLYLKFINLDFVMGNTRRSIEGSQNIVLNTTTQMNDTTIVSGTFKRKVWGARTSFGSGRTFQFGLNVVKGRDDPKSIDYGKNPEENLGVGTDLFWAFDKNRIIISGSANASSYNPNILDGEDIPFDTLQNAGIDIDKKVYDIAKSLITLNQYIIPVPGLAYEAQLRLNYFNNYFSFTYNSVDESFHSLGQPFLLRDNRGFTVADNIRVFQNQVFFNLRYMSYENNLNDIKPATTNNKTIGMSLSYFPIGRIPSVTVGFTNYARENGLSNNATLGIPEDNSTNSLNFSTSYGFLFNEWNNRLTVNLMNYDRNDNVTYSLYYYNPLTTNQDTIPYNLDNLSNTLSVLLQTQYQFPLKTNLEFSIQQSTNKFSSGESKLSLSSFGAGGEYLFKNLFNNNDQLSLGTFIRYGSVSTETPFAGTDLITGNRTIQTTKVDYGRFFLNGRILYHLPQFGRISLNADLVSYSGDQEYSDYIITTRYDVNL